MGETDLQDKAERQASRLRAKLRMRVLRKVLRRLVPWRTLLTVAGLTLLVLTATSALHGFLALAAMLVLLVTGWLAEPPAVRAPIGGAARPRPLQHDHLGAMRSVAAGLPDPCMLLTAEGKVLFQNEAAREVLGRTIEGRPISAFLRAPDVLQAVRDVAQTGKPVQFAYSERVPMNRSFDAHMAPLHEAAAEKIHGLVLVLHDLTKQQQLERMRVDFVANASHELRTPLASLTGFIETMQGPAKADPVAQEKFLGIMRQQAWRMSRLIDDLLSLSRIESNAHVLPDALVDMVEVARHVADSMRHLAQGVGVKLDLDLPQGPVFVRGARDELFQVTQNLMENAIKYGEAGEKVELSVTMDEGMQGAGNVILSVRDFGPGIAPEHLPRLTERFYRVDVASSREKGGTGLGLAIVKHIVNRHRGTLNVDSVPGKGAVFSVTLKRVAQGNRVGG